MGLRRAVVQLAAILRGQDQRGTANTCRATLLVVMAALLGWGCDGGNALGVEAAVSTLPPCAADVGPDHYCPDGRVACWNDPTMGLPVMGATGCTVPVKRDTITPVEQVECVPSCLVGPAPAITCVTSESKANGTWCGLDVTGLETFATGVDCYASYNCPPSVVHNVKVCP